MWLHVSDHLQKQFMILMNLAYDLKRKDPVLKRNIKFDEAWLLRARWPPWRRKERRMSGKATIEWRTARSTSPGRKHFIGNHIHTDIITNIP